MSSLGYQWTPSSGRDRDPVDYLFFCQNCLICGVVAVHCSQLPWSVPGIYHNYIWLGNREVPGAQQGLSTWNISQPLSSPTGSQLTGPTAAADWGWTARGKQGYHTALGPVDLCYSLTIYWPHAAGSRLSQVGRSQVITYLSISVIIVLSGIWVDCFLF